MGNKYVKHECDKMPNYVEIRRLARNDWDFHHLDGSNVGIRFCPFCSVELESTTQEQEENYAKKSAALIISAHLHISEQGAEQIVELLIEAVKHELASNSESP